MTATLPTVDDAKAIAKAHRLPQAAILFVTPEGHIGYASHGRSKKRDEAFAKLCCAILDQLIVGNLPSPFPQEEAS